MLDSLPENLAEVEFPTPTKKGSMLEQQDPREVGKQRAVERPRSRDPWLNSSEAQRTIERFTPRTLDELDEEPDPDWLIDRHLPEDGFAVLCGEYSGGKSFVAMDWSMSIAAGVPWLGHEVKQGEVVYIYAEGARGLKKRARAWRQEHGVAENPKGFRAISCSVNVLDEKLVACAIASIKASGAKPRLIVIDTLARCFGAGDENSTKDMNAFVNACAEMREEFDGATILVVHHVGKDEKKGSRGANALPAAADIAFTVKKPNVKSLSMTMKNSKPHKDSAALDDRHFQLVEIELDDGQTSLVLRLANEKEIREQLGQEQAEESPRALKISGIEETFQALLGLMPAGGRHKDWMDASNKPKATFDRHRLQLIQDGRVKQNDDGFYLAAADGPGANGALSPGRGGVGGQPALPPIQPL
jgi:RecA-family ATPase